MRVAAFLALLSSVALGDVVFKNAGVTKGPVTSINCAPDAGLYCARDAGSVGTISCSQATPTEPGCISPSPQTFAGSKSFNDYVRLVGVAHGSLVACDGAHQNMAQGCTTHGALVWCNGTSNIENTGSSQIEQVLLSVFVDGVPTGIPMGSTTLSGAGATVTAIQASWIAGLTLDAGVLTLQVSDGTNICACPVPCGNSLATPRVPCSGSCTFAAGASLSAQRVITSGCNPDPVVIGNMEVMGTRQ